jgi:hypothetical protein
MHLARIFRAGAVVAAMGAAIAAPAVAQASVTVTSHFVVDGSNAQVSGDTTFINNGATNSRPNDLLFVTQNWDPNDVCPCTYQPAPVGVWYDTGDQKWGVFTENGSAMPTTASFNVLAVPASSNSVFVHRSTVSNDSGDFTLLNSSLTNNKPNVQLQVTQNWNPGGVGGAYNDHQVGVWYDAAKKKWAIFNEDETSMSAGLAFNVMVGATPSNGALGIVQQTTQANRIGDGTAINKAKSNGDPNAVVFATPNWNPGGKGGSYNRATPGVWFDGSQPAVFNENGATMNLKSAYDVLIFAS